MRRPLFLAVVLTLICGSCYAVPVNKAWRNSLKPVGKAGPQIVLASGGQAKYVILLPAKATTQEEKAAADLSKWLGQMTDAKFLVLHEGPVYKRTLREISIGRTDLLAGSKPAGAEADLGDEGYTIAADGDTLFLLGGKTRGIVNSVYALLEEDLGCRWYDRGEGTIPHIRNLAFRPVLRKFVPKLAIRDPFYWDAFDGTWSLRNRTNAPDAAVPPEWGGNIRYALFVHTFNNLVSPDLFKDHPEYFGEFDGARKQWQLCLTNTDVVRIATDSVRRILREKPDCKVISVDPTDGGGTCTCSKCKPICDEEGSNAGLLMRFVNQIADNVKDEFPDVKLSFLAYLDTFMPPKVSKPRDNVIVRLCSDSHAWGSPFLLYDETDKFQAAMKGWQAIGARISIWDYTTNFSHYSVIMPNMPVVTPAIRFYVDHNAWGVMLQGAYQSPGSDNASLRCWVWAKQLWDPSYDTIPLMKDFVYGYYGKAAEPLWKYNQSLWDMWQYWHGKWKKGDKAGNDITTHIRYEPTSSFLSKQFLDESFALMAEAEKLAEDPETMRRVKLAKFPLLYTAIYQAIASGDAAKALAEKNDVIQYYQGLVSEFARIAESEKVEMLSEVWPGDAKAKIANWKTTVGLE